MGVRMKFEIYKAYRQDPKTLDERIVFWLKAPKHMGGDCNIFELPRTVYEANPFLKNNLDWMIENMVSQVYKSVFYEVRDMLDMSFVRVQREIVLNKPNKE